MSAPTPRDMDRAVAVLLHVGTWAASVVVTAGLLLPSGAAVVTAGIALFIALPILRVALLSFAFLRHGDWRIGAISALVLAIILLGIVLAMRGHAVAA